MNNMDEKYLDMAERIARLESFASESKTDREAIKKAQIENHKDVTALRKDIHDLLNKVSKWEGRFGGVIFIIGCLWAFLSGAAKAMLDWISLTGGTGK